MIFIYKIKGFEGKKQIKNYLESQFVLLKEKYVFISEEDQVHVEFEMLKELKYITKIQFHIYKLGKILNSSDMSENIYTSINAVKQKIDTQILKIKTKRESKN